jgi:NTE family protein
MSRVGLVLGAGGVTGDAFHRGVLRALDERGWDARTADVVVGTSAGAMGGAVGSRPGANAAGSAAATVHGRRLGRAPDLAPLLGALRRPWATRPGVLATSLLPTGRRSTDFLVAGLRGHHGGEWPTEPLYVVAVRRRDGKRVVFGQDGAPRTDVAHAVAASCAIPGYFHPVEIDGEVYVDGGVHSPTNADVVADRDLDVLVVSSPMSVDPRHVGATLDLPMRLAFHRYLRRETARLRRRGVPVVVVEPGGSLLSVMGVNPMRGARLDEVEAASAARAHEVLDRLDPDVLARLTGSRSGPRRSAAR